MKSAKPKYVLEKTIHVVSDVILVQIMYNYAI